MLRDNDCLPLMGKVIHCIPEVTVTAEWTSIVAVECKCHSRSQVLCYFCSLVLSCVSSICWCLLKAINRCGRGCNRIRCLFSTVLIGLQAIATILAITVESFLLRFVQGFHSHTFKCGLLQAICFGANRAVCIRCVLGSQIVFKTYSSCNSIHCK